MLKRIGGNGHMPMGIRWHAETGEDIARHGELNAHEQRQHAAPRKKLNLEHAGCRLAPGTHLGQVRPQPPFSAPPTVWQAPQPSATKRSYPSRRSGSAFVGSPS